VYLPESFKQKVAENEAQQAQAAINAVAIGGARPRVAILREKGVNSHALHRIDFDAAGFEWVIGDDAENTGVAYLRKSTDGDLALVVLNLPPVVRENYLVGVPRGGRWREVLNTDATVYGGSGLGNAGVVEAVHAPAQGREWSAEVTLPPLAALVLLPQ
jgi:1,4-alpha-glucan branching enzyme